ncbi:MAG: hypothetical protein V1747_03900 [Candidatus Omnitrophota bacterium]
MNPRSHRIELYGIVNKCPFPQPIDTCPSLHIRTLPLEQRLQWVRSLADANVQEIIELHEKCYNQRIMNNELPDLAL